MVHMRCTDAIAHADKATVHEALSDTRVAMCRAVVREMHIEIHKHSLRKNGEDDIYDTVPAICMAIVQNYTLAATPPPSRSWSLTKRATKLDDDESPDPSAFENLMVLKQCCESFTDDLQQELSELMYRAALESDVEPIVEAFCSKPEVVRTSPPPPPPRRRPAGTGTGGKPKRELGGSDSGVKKGKAVSGAKSKAAPAADEMPDMESLLKKYDTDGTIANLMEMERENPEAMLEPEQLQQARADAATNRASPTTHHPPTTHATTTTTFTTVATQTKHVLSEHARPGTNPTCRITKSPHPTLTPHPYRWPLAYVYPHPRPHALRRQVQDGSIDVRCEVCRAASKAAFGRARKLRALRDEVH